MKNLLRTNFLARSFYEKTKMLEVAFSSPITSLMRQIEMMDIKYILDVGANVGQFSLDMLRYGYRGKIISFEPLNSSFEKLQRNSKKYQNWEVKKLALGDAERSEYINISGNSALSSSFLSMNDTHLNNFPTSKTIGRELVTISTLDNEIRQLDIDPAKTILKLDVQGYEARILQGCSLHLPKLASCFLEASLVQLYDDEIIFLELLNILGAADHHVIDIFRGVKGGLGNLLQVDLLTQNIKVFPK